MSGRILTGRIRQKVGAGWCLDGVQLYWHSPIGNFADRVRQRYRGDRAKKCQMSKVVILTVIRSEPSGVDLSRQPQLHIADRRNVVELWRVRLNRTFQQLDRVLANDYRPGGDSG